MLYLHVAAVIRLGLLRFEGWRARCRRPSALLSLALAFDWLPALGHSGQAREVSVFAIQDLAVHVDWPVVVQLCAVRVLAQPESQPLGARVFVGQVSESVADDGIVVSALRVLVPAVSRRTEVRAKFERERI